jgi:hypothetical protein
MSCCDEINIDGTTVRNLTLIDARIVGGELLGTVLGTDCRGQAVRAGQTPLATCADLAAAIDSLPTPGVSVRVTAVTFTADGRLVISLSDGSSVDTPTPASLTTDQVAAVFRTCAGQPHTPGTRVPTCAEMQDAIDTAAAGHRIGITGANPPATSENDTLPTTLYGARDGLLGRPIGWVNIGGYVMPYFAFVDCGANTATATESRASTTAPGTTTRRRRARSAA